MNDIPVYRMEVKFPESFNRESFGRQIVNVKNGVRFYFDKKNNCDVYEMRIDPLAHFMTQIP